MPADTTASLVGLLAQYRILDAGLLEKVAKEVQPRFPDPRELCKELIRRSWLTPLQANSLLTGRAAELVIGSYVLVEKLGEGGMGQVYRARHQTMERIVALKVIRKERLANPEAVKRFKREIQIAAQMAHPNIVRGFDADQIGNSLFFAMEFVDGVTLSRLVRKTGPLPIPVACDYIRQAALGLQHAMECGLVHRDIKPSNLLVTHPGGKAASRQGGGTVKILDMGLARVDQGDEELTDTLTREGFVLGTVDYLAPEQALNAHQADIRADLYSLGCTFYFLLTGKVPFPEGSSMDRILKHRSQQALLIEQLRPDCPVQVAEIVRKLMAKRPEDRIQTPGELVNLLGPQAQIRPGRASPAAQTMRLVPQGGRPVAPVPAPMPQAQQAPLIQTPPPPPGSSGRQMLVVIGVVAVLFLLLAMGSVAVAVFMFLSHDDGPRRPRRSELPTRNATVACAPLYVSRRDI